MKNFVLAFIIIAVVSLALFYIIRQKKKGAKCIGCPYSSTCGKKHLGCNR